MDFSYALVGLGLIVLAWLVQIVFTLRGDKTMRPCFAGLQLIGISFLVVDSYMSAGEIGLLAWMNVVSAVCALAMLVLIFKK